MPAVAEATGRRCVAINFLGLGKSDKPDDVTYTLALHRDIIAAGHVSPTSFTRAGARVLSAG